MKVTMFLSNSLRRRVREPEDMDDPEIDPKLLRGALRGLTTINVLSASARSVWSPIARLARSRGKLPLRVLDVATGAGDIPLALWQLAQRRGLPLELHGIDISATALAFARQRAENAGAEIKFTRCDAVRDALPGGYDVIVSSLFLHHLDEQPAIQLLRNMAAATAGIVLVNDLRRHWWGLALSHFAGRVLSQSPVVRVDAVRSVRAAFTLDEMKSLAVAAGLTGARLSRRWPCRFLLEWQRAGVRSDE